MAVVLQVDTLAGGVGGNDNPQLVLGGVALEGPHDGGALLVVHPAEQQRDTALLR